MAMIVTFQLEPGSVIAGRYVVQEKIGVGGMGMVFKVVDRELRDDVVCLKTLLPHLAENEEVFKRFLNEVLVARSLSHPNIVRIHDIGKAEEGYYYISMEFVDGFSVKDRLELKARDPKTGELLPPLNFSESLSILYDVLSGVVSAHDRGVMHRDLKPANVLISKRGEVKLADFGTARMVGGDTSLTQAGQVIGTPDYMSPEQIRGDALDARCDIYSFAIMAYELVAGRKPFVADAPVAVAFKHLSEPLPAFPPETPEWFQNIIRQCAAKDRNDRPVSALEVLRVFVQSEPRLGNKTGLFTAEQVAPAVHIPQPLPGTSSVVATTLAREVESSPTIPSGRDSGGWQFSPAPLEEPLRKGAGRNVPLIVLVTVLLLLGAVYLFVPKERISALVFAVTSPIGDRAQVGKRESSERGELEQELLGGVAAVQSTVTPQLSPPVTPQPTAATVAPTVEPTPPPATPSPVLSVAFSVQGGAKAVEDVATVSWTAVLIGAENLSTAQLMEEFSVEVSSIERGSVIGVLRPEELRPEVGSIKLTGSLSDLKRVQPGNYQLRFVRGAEQLGVGEFSVKAEVIKVEKPAEERIPVKPKPYIAEPLVNKAPELKTAGGFPVAAGLAPPELGVPPTPEPTLIPAVIEEYRGTIEYGEGPRKALTLNLEFRGDAISGSAEIESLGSFKVEGKVLPRGQEIILRGSQFGLSLTSGKRGDSIRGSYPMPGPERKRGAWEAVRSR